MPDLKKIYDRHYLRMPSQQEFKILIEETLGIRHVDMFLSPPQLSFRKYFLLRYRMYKLMGGVPLAYILGYIYFLDNKYSVNRHVLIPRPETEELVGYALKLIPSKEKIKLLDIGTGSGVIATTLKKQRNAWGVDALDLSPKALHVAKTNAHNLLHSKKAVKFIEANIANYESDLYDILISNPPYISFSDNLIEPRVKRYEPRKALFSGETGLEFFKLIANRLPNLLRQNGQLFLEFGVGQAVAIKKLFPFFREKIILKDINGKERFFNGRGYHSQRKADNWGGRGASTPLPPNTRKVIETKWGATPPT